MHFCLLSVIIRGGGILVDREGDVTQKLASTNAFSTMNRDKQKERSS